MAYLAVVKLITDVCFRITTYTFTTLFLNERLSRPLPVTHTEIVKENVIDGIVTHGAVGVHALYSNRV